MFKHLFHLKVQPKVMVIGVGSVVVTALILVVVGIWKNAEISTRARAEVDQLVSASLDQTAVGVYNLVKAQDDLLRQQVDHNLEVARAVLNQKGKVSFSSQRVTWTAVNQLTQATTEIELPKMLVGGVWLGQNTDLQVETPVVDQVQSLVGGVSTIFQRMNVQGDMLRVATNVQKADGVRAIGTYVPALNPDGSPNPVIATVLRGETYRGVAYIVNAWYITAYEPILDSSGEVAGLLLVAIKQESVESLRQAIYATRVGKTGYVYVLGGQGDDRGHYIISKDGSRDGENLWEAKDAEGRLFIQEIVGKAVVLKPGEFATVRYPWQNKGETEPRWKVARIVYYEPWDWVIGVSAYEDEFNAFSLRLQEGQSQTTWWFVACGLGLAVIGGLASWFFARSLVKPLKRMVRAAGEIAQTDLTALAVASKAMAAGDLTAHVTLQTQTLTYQSDDEIGDLAVAFNQMIVRLQETGQAFGAMTLNLKHTLGQVAENATSLAVASAQLSDAANQSGQASNQIATTVQQVARGVAQQTEHVGRTANSIEQMRRAIDGVAKGAQEQAAAVGKAAVLTTQMSTGIQQVTANSQAVARDAATAAETARAGAQTVSEAVHGMQTIKLKVDASGDKVREMGNRSKQIGQIIETIDDIAAQTNLLALNAAIEAARAGEHGKGFAVVADEVRKLAEKSAAATKEIAELIRSIQATVKDASVAMEDGKQEVEAGVALANRSGAALQQILQVVTAVTEQSGATLSAVQTMQAASNELVNAMDAMGAVVEENTAATEQMAAGSSEVSQAIEGIASISQQNSAAAEEVGASAEEVNAQVEEVTASAQSLAAMAQSLQEVVSQFKLGEASVKLKPVATPTARVAGAKGGNPNGQAREIVLN